MKVKMKMNLMVIVLFVLSGECARVRHQSPAAKQVMKHLKGIGVNYNNKQTNAHVGLWPPVLNLATKAVISVNATCGEGGREEFCRLQDGPIRNHFAEMIGGYAGGGGGTEHGGRCGVCDNFSRDPHKRHPINYAIDDGTNRWWQSPPLHYGAQYEYVTITLDLKQIYQVVYIKLKAANAPRPGAWILERSVDGYHFEAWQFFATSDKDCLDRYGLPARKGKPQYFTDSEVICTSFYSKLTPMENGEIYTLLVHGRPGANETSPELLEFTKARYVRFRFQGLRGKVEPLPARIAQDINRDKKLFYSIRDILIGGQCVCNGHASTCRHKLPSGNLECECSHNTCGPNCDHCCPLFNQQPWHSGTSRDAQVCRACQCHGHASSCYYDEEVAQSKLSRNAEGEYLGGGVCNNCTRYTMGINCEKCLPGYYRPLGTALDSEVPCVKCDCDDYGSSGECSLLTGTLSCQCKEGYTGLKCDQCDHEYRGYPNCERCPCNQKGSRLGYGEDCEGECTCKENVEGNYCDRCKVGYFSLQASNPDGCSACYCSGVTSVCSSAYLQPQIYPFDVNDKWLVTDISVKDIESPLLDEREMLTVGNNEIIGIEAYYWLAPISYTGNKLGFYGSNLLYKVHWVVMRGDTSGKPTTGPNIILVGQNGMRIAYGDDSYTFSNMTFLIPLDEYHDTWYHIPEDVDDIITRLRRTEYKGERVTRPQFMSVLNDLKHILLRAKFHTDQIEVSLEEMVIYSGNFTDGYSPVEECFCPSGYSGLSCELCQYGYVRVIGNNSKHEIQEYCVKCDCNGHSKTCDGDTGECKCEHNTIGERCERCAAGYYGNPLLGTPGDCKKCACPLVEDENNFSPSCQLDAASISNDDVEPGYVCTQCPRGYTGDHCEICDDGHFGVPSMKKGRCEQCQCGGGPCDRITGQCLSCRGNTEGWKCDRCKDGFFGSPSEGCEACLCDSLGSLSSSCNNITGECLCSEHFIGRTCNKCELGYGNVTAQCVECNCDKVGSIGNLCDQTTGMCQCRPGVEGFRCDACQHLHYGFSNEGCASCNCSLKGSELRTCNIVTGQCRCKQYFIGLTCDRCREGYHEEAYGCKPCECDSDGSETTTCHPQTGQCTCRTGVKGPYCRQCQDGYYGFSKSGCKECEPCSKRGHICDQQTGRCSCPPNSHGEYCDHCKPNHWGFEPNVGCKFCNCSETGATRTQCDLLTGNCICQQGYTGDKCEQCAHGYYGYPKCRRCSCHFPGTDITAGKCDATGVCQCDENGNCPCKSNVIGRRCNQCLEGTFGLHLENEEGCTDCFCFGRSEICTEAGYTWSKIRMKTRTFIVDNIDKPHYEQSPGKSALFLDTNNFQEIEKTSGNITTPHAYFDIPLYWRLPEQFTGDRILSYGGYLRFTTATLPPPTYHGDFTQYPIARIEGNGIKLIHYSNMVLGDRYEVRLHENNWRLEKIHGSTEQMLPVTRDVLMVALQRITGIFIKATDYRTFESTLLMDVALDTGVYLLGSPPPLAMGVEKCTCPLEYNGTSCQNPSLGYHRTPAQPTIVPYRGMEDIDIIIGSAASCSCQGRSKVCDIETGYCLDCSENTSGPSCENCVEGYYGDPATSSCQACACPSVTQNFAISCVPNPRANNVVCKCKLGYYGPTCDRCSPGYYGQPHLPGQSCKPCDCNPDGSRSLECDIITGACACKPGIEGQKCSECSKRRHILENHECVLCDDCVQILLDKVDELEDSMARNTGHLVNGTLQPPWAILETVETRYLNLSEQLDAHLSGKETIREIIDNKETEQLEENVVDLTSEFDKAREKSLSVTNSTRENKLRSNHLLENIEKTKEELLGLKKTLSDFATGQVSTKHALKRGQKLYQEIKKQRANINIKKIDKVRQHCEDVMNHVQQLVQSTYVSDWHSIKSDYNKLENRTNDFKLLLDNLHKSNEMSRLKNNENRGYLKSLRQLYESANKAATDQQKAIKDQINKVESTKDKLNTSMITDFENIQDLLEQVEDRITDDFISSLPGKRQQLEQHVQQLAGEAEKYQKEFNKFNKDLQFLNASGKFKESNLDMIEYSRMTYEEARDDFAALEKQYLFPADNDTLFDKSAISRATSERDQQRIYAIKNWFEKNVTQPQQRLETVINTLKQLNWDNGLANNNVLDKMHQINFDKAAKLKNMRGIEDVIKRAVGSLEGSREIHKIAADLNITKKYNLDKSWEKYLNLTSAENINKFKNNIRFTKDLLSNVSNYNGRATNMDVLNQHKSALDTFNLKQAGIQKKLDQLKNNILKAHQLASMIPIPLNGPDCGRRFRVHNLEPSTKFSLAMEFDVQARESSKTILKLHSPFDGWELVKVATDGSNLLVYFDQNYRLPIPVGHDDDYDYKLTLDETGMAVSHGNNSWNRDFHPSNKLYKISSHDWLELGWGKDEGEYGLPGCIKELTINNREIGLWNFVESRGNCSSCKVFTKNVKGQTYRFNGDSYITFHKLDIRDPRHVNMKFNIRTFDENALIFLVIAEGAYVAITLENGHIRFKMQYKPEVKLLEPVDFTSAKKYNNGKETVISFVKEVTNTDDSIVFKINEGEHKEEYTRDIHLRSRGDLIKILKGNFSIGGIPPNFNDTGLPEDFVRAPYLGLFSAVLGTKALYTERKPHFNVQPYDTQIKFAYDRILLESGGFVRLKHTLDQNYNGPSSISFVVRVPPEEHNGDILQIGDVIFKLHNEKLRVELEGEMVESLDIITDNNYYYVTVDDSFCVKLDGQSPNEKCSGELDFDVNVQILLGGKESIRGVVKEIRINSDPVLITPETYVEHKGAQIGRTLPLAPKPSESILKVEEKSIDMSMKDISPPAMCEKVYYGFEPNAFKFGDSDSSYIEHDLKNGFWKGNYTIEFELRTFFGDGLLFLAQSNEHYNMFFIKEGLLQFDMKGKKIKKIETTIRVDDGKWHRVVVENHHSMQKKNRRLALTIDGVALQRRMPQNRVTNKLFLGFKPRELAEHNIEQFRGCVRSLKINHMSPNFYDRKKTRPHEIGQCFSNIERGSYFRGDSYAIYDRHFRLNNYLDIAFDFRTDQQNGILLSVAAQTNRAALSIELQNGAVVMSVNMGNGEVTNVTNSIVACNNKWHKVIASFTTELSINVDGVTQTWVLNGLEEMRSIEAPLYIGGLPDSAPGGTIKIRENLKGCIRNLSIDNKNIDWINMDELKHISLNSCPVNIAPSA